MKETKEVLKKYIPEQAVNPVAEILYAHKELHLVITKSRTTKLGDYKKINRLQHRISVNYNLHPYQFLITLLHEIAHFLTYKQYGNKIKPHGKEWKLTFGNLLITFIRTDIFPEELIPDLQKYAQNPKASTSGDGSLFLRIARYNQQKNANYKYVFELKKGDLFMMPSGQKFQLGEKRRTRYKCINLINKKTYLVHKNAEVIPINIDDL